MFFEYGFLALCAIVLALLVYRYDMVDRERWTMLLLAVILGMAGCWFAGYAEDYLFLRFDFGIAQMAERAVVVAVFEEVIKLLPIVGIAILFRKQFNDPIDGLIHATYPVDSPGPGLSHQQYSVSGEQGVHGQQSERRWAVDKNQRKVFSLNGSLIGARRASHRHGQPVLSPKRVGGQLRFTNSEAG